MWPSPPQRRKGAEIIAVMHAASVLMPSGQNAVLERVFLTNACCSLKEKRDLEPPGATTDIGATSSAQRDLRGDCHAEQ